MLWIRIWDLYNICHPSLCHKDNRIIRDRLHCFHTMTKIWACSFAKVESSMYYWRTRRQWLNTLLPFISTSAELTCFLIALWTELCSEMQLLPNLSALPVLSKHFCWVHVMFRRACYDYIQEYLYISVYSFHVFSLYWSFNETMKLKIAVNKVIWG